MRDFLSKTLGGLERPYFLRHLFFGLCITVLLSWAMYASANPAKWGNIFGFVICGLLYPYSRFVYESIITFILGDNVFFVNSLLMLTIKMITIIICWIFSVFIAPIGLIWLYFYHNKNNRIES